MPKGYIIVETNYRVYAYTDSNLQVALLGLFTELIYRYNFVKGIQKKVFQANLYSYQKVSVKL